MEFYLRYELNKVAVHILQIIEIILKKNVISK